MGFTIEISEAAYQDNYSKRRRKQTRNIIRKPAVRGTVVQSEESILCSELSYQKYDHEFVITAQSNLTFLVDIFLCFQSQKSW